MEILREILLTLHLLGMAIIVGGYFTVIRSPKVLAGMLHASYLQLLTGLALLTLAEVGEGEVDHVKIGLKLVIAILVSVFAFLGRRQEKQGGARTALRPAAPVGVGGRSGGGAESGATSDGLAPASSPASASARPDAPADSAPATVASPSARMAHLTFAFAVLNVLIAVFLR